MPNKVHPDQIKDAFELYLQFNGERFDLIETEMRKKGWTTFGKQNLLPKGKDENFREGWIQKYGWENALKIKIATLGTLAMTSAESLMHEVETIRKALFIELEANKLDKDKLYLHDKYVARSIDILAELNDARDNHGNFILFLERLCGVAPQISPDLAKAIVDAKDGLLSWAESEFATAETMTTK
jgi:hypothetical protein